MRIVVLDGHTLSPGDLSWKAFESLGDLVIWKRTPPESVSERAQDADILLTNKTELSAETLEALAPGLKYIGVLATGVNVVDLDAANRLGIPVTNVPAYGLDAVAQSVMALILELANRVGDHARAVRENRWSECEDFCFWDAPLISLSGKTLGLVGFGGIAQRVSQIAMAFGMKIRIAVRSTPPLLPEEIEIVSLERLTRESDIVSLHCPLTPETENMVNAEFLSRMKKTAFLINTARGAIVDETALDAALRNGTIAGAGLDVLSKEPPEADHPLYFAPNCFITPHIAWAARSARKRLMEIAVENIVCWKAGKPQNRVA